jgi:hypothetical protein
MPISVPRKWKNKSAFLGTEKKKSVACKWHLLNSASKKIKYNKLLRTHPGTNLTCISTSLGGFPLVLKKKTKLLRAHPVLVPAGLGYGVSNNNSDGVKKIIPNHLIKTVIPSLVNLVYLT